MIYNYPARLFGEFQEFCTTEATKRKIVIKKVILIFTLSAFLINSGGYALCGSALRVPLLSEARKKYKPSLKDKFFSALPVKHMTLKKNADGKILWEDAKEVLFLHVLEYIGKNISQKMLSKEFFEHLKKWDVSEFAMRKLAGSIKGKAKEADKDFYISIFAGKKRYNILGKVVINPEKIRNILETDTYRHIRLYKIEKWDYFIFMEQFIEKVSSDYEKEHGSVITEEAFKEITGIPLKSLKAVFTMHQAEVGQANAEGIKAKFLKKLSAGERKFFEACLALFNNLSNSKTAYDMEPLRKAFHAQLRDNRNILPGIIDKASKFKFNYRLPEEAAVGNVVDFMKGELLGVHHDPIQKKMIVTKDTVTPETKRLAKRPNIEKLKKNIVSALQKSKSSIAQDVIKVLTLPVQEKTEEIERIAETLQIRFPDGISAAERDEKIAVRLLKYLDIGKAEKDSVRYAALFNMLLFIDRPGAVDLLRKHIDIFNYHNALDDNSSGVRYISVIVAGFLKGDLMRRFSLFEVGIARPKAETCL